MTAVVCLKGVAGARRRAFAPTESFGSSATGFTAGNEAGEAGGDEGYDEEDDARHHQGYEDEAALPEFPARCDEADERAIDDHDRINGEGHQEGHAGAGGKTHLGYPIETVRFVIIETSRFVQVFSSGEIAAILAP